MCIRDRGGSIGTRQFLGDQMMFSRSGQTSMPRHAHAMWFLAQYARFGLVKQAPDYEAVADRLLMTDLYREVAKEAGLKLPTDDMAKIKTTLDGLTFDPKRPADFVRAHPIPV